MLVLINWSLCSAQSPLTSSLWCHLILQLGWLLLPGQKHFWRHLVFLHPLEFMSLVALQIAGRLTQHILLSWAFPAGVTCCVGMSPPLWDVTGKFYQMRFSYKVAPMFWPIISMSLPPTANYKVNASYFMYYGSAPHLTPSSARAKITVDHTKQFISLSGMVWAYIDWDCNHSSEPSGTQAPSV